MIAKEIEKEGIPVAYITAMATMGTQLKANRVITGIKIPHPCGDPNLPKEADLALRKDIIRTSLEALQTEVSGPTNFIPSVAKYTFG